MSSLSFSSSFSSLSDSLSLLLGEGDNNGVPTFIQYVVVVVICNGEVWHINTGEVDNGDVVNCVIGKSLVEIGISSETGTNKSWVGDNGHLSLEVTENQDIVPSQDQCTIKKLGLEVPEDLTPTEEK